MRPSIAAIIIGYEDRRSLRRCLASLAGSAAPDEIIVVDNSKEPLLVSDDIPTTKNPLRYFHQQGRNLGYGAAVNVGVRESECDWLLILNQDAYAQAETLNRLRRQISEAPTQDCLVPRIVFARDTKLIDNDGLLLTPLGVGIPRNRNEKLGAGYAEASGSPTGNFQIGPSGAAFAVKRSVFCEIGGFDEKIHMYCEDVDLGLKLRKNGARIAPEPGIVFEHRHSGLSGNHVTRYLKIIRNGGRVAHRHFRLFESIAAVPRTSLLLLRYLTRFAGVYYVS